MVSSVSNDVNLDKVDGEINSILNDIKNIFDQGPVKINVQDQKVDQGQCGQIAQKLMQVC